jgi:hypothetical protein
MSFPSSPIAAFAVAAALRCMFRVETEVEESVMVLARDHDDVTAAAAVATAGTAPGYKLFTPERETAVAAIASFYQNCSFVDEHG